MDNQARNEIEQLAREIEHEARMQTMLETIGLPCCIPVQHVVHNTYFMFMGELWKN